MKNVLITGATGFVGAHVTEEVISKGANVTALINEFPKGGLFEQKALLQGVNPVVGSLLDYDLLEKTLRENNIDTVLHIAARWTQPLHVHETILERGARDDVKLANAVLRGVYCK